MKQTITFGRNGKRYSVDVDIKEVTNMTFKEMEDYAWKKVYENLKRNIENEIYTLGISPNSYDTEVIDNVLSLLDTFFLGDEEDAKN